MALLAAIGVMVVSVGLVYAEISCEPIAVRTGEPAYIICLFDVDVSVAKKNIKVQRRPLTSTRFDPDKTETVLDCYWQNAADFSCQFGNGFKLVGEAGRTAVVRIQSASKIDEQVYMCEVVPSDPSNIQTCTLTMRDAQPSDGNFSLTNFIPKRLEDETAEVKGMVTAIIIMCVIIILVLAVLLILLRKKLRENVQRCSTWLSSHTASPSQGDTEDPVNAPMLTASNDHAGDKDKSAIDSKDKERIEICVRHVLKIIDTEKLSDTDKTKNSVSELAHGSAAASDSRPKHLRNDTITAQAGESAEKDTRASEKGAMPKYSESHDSFEEKLPKDPRGLQITVDEWYKRELQEHDRKKKEIEAQRELYAIRESNQKEKEERMKKDERKGITDPNEDPERRKRREEAEKKRMDAEKVPAIKLETILKKHDAERQWQQKEDRDRIERALEKVQAERKKRSQSEKVRGAVLLSQVPESAGGEDKDILIFNTPATRLRTQSSAL